MCVLLCLLVGRYSQISSQGISLGFQLDFSPRVTKGLITHRESWRKGSCLWSTSPWTVVSIIHALSLEIVTSWACSWLDQPEKSPTRWLAEKMQKTKTRIVVIWRGGRKVKVNRENKEFVFILRSDRVAQNSLTAWILASSHFPFGQAKLHEAPLTWQFIHVKFNWPLHYSTHLKNIKRQ